MEIDLSFSLFKIEKLPADLAELTSLLKTLDQDYKTSEFSIFYITTVDKYISEFLVSNDEQFS